MSVNYLFASSNGTVCFAIAWGCLTTNLIIGTRVDPEVQAPVVQKVDKKVNAIHRINHYPAESEVCFVKTYPLDSAIQRLNNRGPAVK